MLLDDEETVGAVVCCDAGTNIVRRAELAEGSDAMLDERPADKMPELDGAEAANDDCLTDEAEVGESDGGEVEGTGADERREEELRGVKVPESVDRVDVAKEEEEDEDEDKGGEMPA